jgi:hypothetical protein
MDIITTHMSMHANNRCFAAVTSTVAIEFGNGSWCRGMLALGGSGGASVPRTYGEGGSGGELPPERGSQGRHENVGVPEAAGTSHSRGRRGGRHVERGSSSDTD